MNSDNFVADSSGDIDILDSLARLWKRRVPIIFFTGIVGLVTVLIVLMMPNIYIAKAVLLPPSKKNVSLAGMMAQISSIPLLSNALPGEQELDSMDVLKAHLSKKSNLWDVINKFKLVQHYNIDTGLEIDVEQAYLSNLSIKKDRKTNLVTVTFEDENPKLAKQVVNYNLTLLSRISKTTVITENQKKKIFLERRLHEAKLDLKKIEERIKSYQEENHILSIDSQAKATIEVVSKIQAEIMINLVKVKVKMELGAHESHPEIKALNLEIIALRKQVEQVEKGSLIADNVLDKSERSRGLTFVPLSRIPEMKMELEQLMREKMVQQEVFKVLAKEYELVKIESAKDQEMIEVIDQAHLPERKSKPRRAVICILSTMLAFFLSCFTVLCRDSLLSVDDNS